MQIPQLLNYGVFAGRWIFFANFQLRGHLAPGCIRHGSSPVFKFKMRNINWHGAGANQPSPCGLPRKREHAHARARRDCPLVIPTKVLSLLVELQYSNGSSSRQKRAHPTLRAVMLPSSGFRQDRPTDNGCHPKHWYSLRLRCRCQDAIVPEANSAVRRAESGRGSLALDKYLIGGLRPTADRR